jgi:hypothetical protein
MRIVLAAAVVLAVTGVARTAIVSVEAARLRTSTQASAPQACMATTDDELRGRVVDVEQTLDRMLADTTPASVGTSGVVGATPDHGPVTVDRARLMQMRRQLESLLGALNGR